MTIGLAVAIFLLGATATAGDTPPKQLRLPRPLSADAGAAESPVVPLSPSQPDPVPLVARRWWIFDLSYDDGDLSAGPTTILDKGHEESSARMMGRFAVEMYDGEELVERVRFDFPMLGVDGTRATRKGRPEAHVKTRIGVLFPVTKRGTRLELWDRALDRRWSLPWPEEHG